MSNSQINKLKSGMEIGIELTLKLSSYFDGDSNQENNFSHKLLSSYSQDSGLHKAFANGSSANIKLSKTQLYKIVQSGGFLGRF